MPSNILSVDEFPSFTGEESPTEQIRQLHNYLFVLREQLQYSLSNLTVDNWNAAAMTDMTNKVSATVNAMVSGMTQTLNRISAKVGKLEAAAVKQLLWENPSPEEPLDSVTAAIADAKQYSAYEIAVKGGIFRCRVGDACFLSCNQAEEAQCRILSRKCLLAVDGKLTIDPCWQMLYTAAASPAGVHSQNNGELVVLAVYGVKEYSNTDAEETGE